MTYIIDYENVSQSGFVGHETLSADDEVIVFFSPCHKKVETTLLINSPASFRFIGIQPNGHKNYMDFQIAALCASLVCNNKTVAIVSNDKGYAAVKDFFQNNILWPQGYDVALFSNLKKDPVTTPAAKTTPFVTKAATPATPADKTTTDIVPKETEATADDPSDKMTTKIKNAIADIDLSDEQRRMLLIYANHIARTDKKNKPTEHEFEKGLGFIKKKHRKECLKVLIPLLLKSKKT